MTLQDAPSHLAFFQTNKHRTDAAKERERKRSGPEEMCLCVAKASVNQAENSLSAGARSHYLHQKLVNALAGRSFVNSRSLEAAGGP
jgi:hypothetical protein